VSDRAPAYDSAVRVPPVLGELRELVRYRDLLALLISNINTTRYKRSTLGVVWSLLNPLLHMAVLTVAFSKVFRFSIDHYPVYVLAGLIVWNFFTQTTSYAMSTMVWGGSLLKRIYLPRSIFAAASIGNGLVNLALSLAPLLLVVVLTGHPVHATWAFVPVAVLLVATFALGVALLMSALAVFFSDVVEMYGVAVQAWFFLTPVIYPREILPDALAPYLALNPFFPLLETFRAPIYDGALPSGGILLAAVAAALASLALGLLAFTAKADEIAYRV